MNVCRWLAPFLLLWTAPAFADPPIVDDAARFEAERVRMMSDTDPTSRMLMLLAAREFDDAALFALAGSHPGLVEQLVSSEYQSAVDYIAQLPPGELHRVRAGETIVRTPSSMTPSERSRIDAIVDELGHAPKRFQAVRIGPLDGQVYRFEVTVLARRKRPISQSISLCWPATPERDEESRAMLSRHFGARPSQTGSGQGAAIPLQEPSFEGQTALGESWTLQSGVMLGLEFPTNDVEIDGNVAIDGFHSLRFHASEDTRHFQSVVQTVTVGPGVTVRARAQVQADNLRVEFQQQASTVYLKLQFVDAAGFPIGDPVTDIAQLGTHAWQPLEVQQTAPEQATHLQVELLSGVSGTAWFDGVSIEVR